MYERICTGVRQYSYSSGRVRGNLLLITVWKMTQRPVVSFVAPKCRKDLAHVSQLTTCAMQ